MKSMSSFAPTLLIFHPGALGDGLLALAALRIMKHKFPDHRMIWFGHKELGDVLVNAHEVHQSYSFDKLNLLAYGGAKGFGQGPFSSLFDRCKRAIGWMDDPDGIWGSWLTSVGIRNFILRSPHDPVLRNVHMADRYVEILQPWVTSRQTFKQSEKTVHEECPLVCRQSGLLDQPWSFKEPLIVLHPGSGGTHKCASPALWASIVNDLMARPHRKVCLIGGPADTDSLRNVQELVAHLKPKILTDMDLLSVGCYLQYARLFIGHDSGLSHLAASLGVPSVLLFGPTDPDTWAPRGKHVAIMRNACHCVGKEFMDQCIDKPCLSISTTEIMAKAEEQLWDTQTSMSPAHFGFVDESPHVSCLG